MRTLLDKAVLFALCLILHITLTGDMRPGSVVALLAAGLLHVAVRMAAGRTASSPDAGLLRGYGLPVSPNSSGSCQQSPMTPCVCGPSA